MTEVIAALFAPVLVMIVMVMISEKAFMVCLNMVGFVKSLL